LLKLKTEAQTIYRKPHRKITKLKSKFYLFHSPGATLLGWPKMLNLYIIYAPNEDKDIIRFFSNFLITLQNENLEEEENIIVGGDFNGPLNTLLDKKGGIMIPRKLVVASIDCIQSELDLVDTDLESKKSFL